MLTPAQVDRTIAQAKKANINALFVEVRKAGDAYYNSSYEPRAQDLSGAPPDWDALQYIIQKAHAAGIEVHAWMVAFRIWEGKKPPESPRHVLRAHPDWLNKDYAGREFYDDSYYLDPGIPAVRDYTVNVVLDLVKHYDVDGIHLDYIRYPGKDWGYSHLAMVNYQQETGRARRPKPSDPAFSEWRRECVTRVVRRIYEGVQATKPWVKVSVAAIPWGNATPDFAQTVAYRSVFQDWRGWAKAGIVDAIIPMNYSTAVSPKSAARWMGWCDLMRDCRLSRQAYTGIIFNQPVSDVVRQIREARDKGLDGEVGFAFTEGPARDRLVAELAREVYQTPAPTPPMPWKPAAGTSPVAGLYDQAVQKATAGDVQGAALLLRQVVTADPRSVQGYFRLGRCYMRLGRPYAAKAMYEKVLELDPNNSAAAKELQAWRPSG